MLYSTKNKISMSMSMRLHHLLLGYTETDKTEIKPYLARFKNWVNARACDIHKWPCHWKAVPGVCHFGVGDLLFLSTRWE